MIIVGSILTFFSGFGMLVTIAGVWNGSYIRIFCPAFGCPPLTLGPGYWLGWTGATISLIGHSWMPLPKSVEGRKLVGSILFPAGVVAVVIGSLLAASSFSNYSPLFLLSIIEVVSGFLLSGTALYLYFRSDSTPPSRISRALEKPVL